MKVFKNRLLRKIFGSKTDEVTWDCTRLHNEELYELYPSQNIIRVIQLRTLRWAGHVARMGNRRRLFRVLVERLETMKQISAPRRRLEDNIKMYMDEVFLIS